MSIRNKAITTKNESSLHRSLKNRYTGPKGRTEAETGGFVADGINEKGEFIEVQTGSFAPLRKKVKAFTALGKVRIIHPIAVTKTINVYDPKGKLLYKRKSPVKGSLWLLFDALIHAPELPLTKGLSVEAVLADISENRVKDGKGSWRRKGVSLKDRELASFRESVVFKKPADYLRFIPFKKGEEFTVSALAANAQINQWTARKALYVLNALKVVKRVGKKGNAWIYKVKGKSEK